MNVKKTVVFLLLAFLIFYVLTSPVESADLVQGAGEVLSSAADSMSTFMTELF